MRKIGSFKGSVLLMMALASAAPGAHAFSCFTLGRAVDESAYYLKRASDSSDLQSALGEARRARPMLTDAASAALACDCEEANTEFEEASEVVGNAISVGDPHAFRRLLSRAVKKYNAGVRGIESCADDDSNQEVRLP